MLADPPVYIIVFMDPPWDPPPYCIASGIVQDGGVDCEQPSSDVVMLALALR